MLKMYFLIALRNFYKDRSTTMINVLGLSIAFISLAAIYLFVNDERSFDTFHSKGDRIYRLWETFSATARKSAIMPYAWRPYLIEELGEVENATSFQLTNLVIRKGEDVYLEDESLVTDTSFFQIFDFPITHGSSDRLLFAPNEVLLSEDLAVRYFGNVQAALGQELEIAIAGNFESFQVKAIVDCPSNSHVQFSVVIPEELFKRYSHNPPAYDNWSLHFVYAYLLLKEPVNERAFAVKLSEFLKSHDERLVQRYAPGIQPLQEVYDRSDMVYDFAPRGSDLSNNILLTIGWMILVIALINYVNLSTARSMKRIKEVGIRKVFGSTRRKLVLQFLIESWILSHMALLVAIVSTTILLPYITDLTGKTLFMTDLFSGDTIWVLIFASNIAGIAGGAYPAWYFSNTRPLTALQKSSNGASPGRGYSLRAFLVTFQFVVAIILIAGTAVMVRQIDFLTSKDLGFDMEQTIVVNDMGSISADKVKRERLKNVLLSNPNVSGVSASSSYPGIAPWVLRFSPEGNYDATGDPIACIFTDDDFLSTYQIEIIEGRNINEDMASDTSAFLISEAALHEFALHDSTWLTNPIGKRLRSGYLGIDGKVVGVFRDIHFESLHTEVKPLILLTYFRNYFNFNIRLTTADLPQTLQEVEAAWKSLFPEAPFQYSFTNEEFARNYSQDHQLQRLVSVLSFIAILIATIGLFGLSAFSARQRRKEISIRKVMGATETSLILDQTFAFIKLVILSNLIAFPLVLIFTNAWLGSFAYRIKVPLETFLWTFLITVMVTVLTTGYEALRTARSNPARVLATE